MIWTWLHQFTSVTMYERLDFNMLQRMIRMLDDVDAPVALQDGILCFGKTIL